jgi:hypothetical protein
MSGREKEERERDVREERRRAFFSLGCSYMEKRYR